MRSSGSSPSKPLGPEPPSPKATEKSTGSKHAGHSRASPSKPSGPEPPSSKAADKSTNSKHAGQSGASPSKPLGPEPPVSGATKSAKPIHAGATEASAGNAAKHLASEPHSSSPGSKSPVENRVHGAKTPSKKVDGSPAVPATSKSSSKSISEVNCNFTDVTDCGEAYEHGKPIGKKSCTKIGGISVVVETACAFLKMEKAAESSSIGLRLKSGFRTQAKQTELYGCYLTKKCNSGNLAESKPGFSNHQNGIALDISVSDPRFSSG
ncbi:hypothetical protein BC829DRAFT_63344 [Chytridium lagenaria]|nr:hypothetical protein BC829DRAFT_63344 [Chytridium lagenaria]